MPDFALDSSSGINAPSPLQEVENLPASSLACDLPSPGAPVVSPRQNGHSFNAVFSGYEPQGSGRHSSGGLPDFLSDSALNSVNNPLDDAYDDDVATIQVNGDLELEIRRVRDIFVIPFISKGYQWSDTYENSLIPEQYFKTNI